MWKQVAAAGLFCAGCESPAHTSPRSLLDARIEADLDAGGEEMDATLPSPDAAAREDGAHTGAAHATPWLRTEVLVGADGRSAALTFPLGQLHRPVFALRTYASGAAESGRLCFQLEDTHADLAEWVPTATSADYGDFCTSCTQRVAVGSGYGMFVLPSAAAQPENVQTLALRVALRDCLTLSPLSLAAAKPSSLIVESFSFSAPARDAPLALPLLIAIATPDALGDGVELAEVFAELRKIWRAAGIELSLRGPVALPRPLTPVVYGATDREALSVLAHAVEEGARAAALDEATPWLVLTPCLVRRDPSLQGMSQPLAVTAHLPGGFAVDDEVDGIYVAAERCGGLTPAARYLDSASLAAVMAHEVGHYLGLFHVQEADGREDTLADTQPGQPNLMQALPYADQVSLSESQISIARRHPALALRFVEDQQRDRQ